MKKRVILFIKWRSDDGHFLVSQYFVSEEFRTELLSYEFSFAVSLLLFLAYDSPKFCLLGYPDSFLKHLSDRLRSTFNFGWHIDAFSIYKKSLL